MGRALKFTLYASWFWTVFFLCVYLTFPMNSIKRAVIERAEVALGKDHPVKVGKHGVNPKLTIGEMSTYWLSGVSMKRVRVQLPSSNPDPGPTIDIAELNARVGILSLLSDEKSISFSGELYDGSFSGDADVTDKGELRAIEANIEGLKIDRAIVISELAGGPIGGVLNADVTLTLGENPAKEGDGEIVIKGNKLTAGPGDFKLPGSPLPIGLPYVELGNLDATIDVKKGKATSKTIALADGNITADVDLQATLSKRLGSSRISGSGNVLVDETFLKQPDNSKLKSALEIASAMPQFKRAQDSEGRIHFDLRGSLSSPKPALSRNAGKKKKKRTRP